MSLGLRPSSYVLLHVPLLMQPMTTEKKASVRVLPKVCLKRKGDKTIGEGVIYTHAWLIHKL